MTWREYLDQVDDSHQMTTAKEHIALLCEIAEQCENILELGSHAGISTAALALASPKAHIVSVDLCDTVSESDRVGYWASLGATNIVPVSCTAAEYLTVADKNLPDFDLLFHDAAHGDGVMPEYEICCRISKTVAIHDFDQLSLVNQDRLISLCKRVNVFKDSRDRLLFIGRKA